MSHYTNNVKALLYNENTYVLLQCMLNQIEKDDMIYTVHLNKAKTSKQTNGFAFLS